MNFIALREYLEGRTIDKNVFDFMKEYKTEVFKLIQSRELHRMVTNSGQLLLAKFDAGKYMYPLITMILDAVKGTELNEYVVYLNNIFKPYEPKDANYSRSCLSVFLTDLEKIIQNKYNLNIEDKQHHNQFFKDFIFEDKFLYQGFVNKVLTILFPGLEDNIEYPKFIRIKIPDLLLAYILTIEKKEENPARIFSSIDLGSLYTNTAEHMKR